MSSFHSPRANGAKLGCVGFLLKLRTSYDTQWPYSHQERWRSFSKLIWDGLIKFVNCKIVWISYWQIFVFYKPRDLFFLPIRLLNSLSELSHSLQDIVLGILIPKRWPAFTEEAQACLVSPRRGHRFTQASLVGHRSPFSLNTIGRYK